MNCHYKDVPFNSSPSTPELDPHNIDIHIDNSGYRPSVEGDFCKASRHNSTERPRFELPRLSSILRNQEFARDNRLNEQRIRDDRDMVRRFRKDYQDNTLHVSINDMIIDVNLLVYFDISAGHLIVSILIRRTMVFTVHLWCGYMILLDVRILLSSCCT